MRTEIITSNNLLHIFKKRLVNAQQLNNYLKTKSDSIRRIGTLPVDFFQKIDKNERSKATQNIGDIFERFAIETEFLDENSNFCDSEMYTGARKKMVDSLKEILHRNDIESCYVDSGSFKNCHKLTIGKFSYALSTFKKYPLYDPKGYFRKSHGKGNEPQNIFTVYKRFSQGRICKPFLANLSGEKSEGGFILSKFIEPEHDKKVELGSFQKARSYVKNTDTSGNTINGIFIEAGGFEPNERYIEDFNLRILHKKFAECLDANINLLKSPLANKVQFDLLNIANSEIPLNSLNYSKEEQKIIKKLIKHLKRIQTLIIEASNKGHLDSVKNLLSEDLRYLYPFNEYSIEFYGNDEVTEAYKGYPLLLSNALGINNVPDIKTMLNMLEEDFCIAEVDFAKYYGKNEIQKFLSNHRNEVKHMQAYKILVDSFKV